MQSRRVIIAFSIVIALTATLGVYALHAVWRLRMHAQAIYAHPFAVSNAMRQIDIDMISMRHDLQAYVDGKGIGRIQDLRRCAGDALRQFDIAGAHFLGDPTWIVRARQAFVAWKPRYAQEIQLVQQHAPAEVIAEAEEGNDAYLAHMNTLMQPVIDMAARKADFLQADAGRRAQADLWWISSLLALVALISSAIAAYVVVSLKKARRKGEEYLDIIVANEQKYRELLDAAPDGIVIVDGRQHIHMANRQAERMFGYDAGGLVGKTIETLVPSALRERHVRWVDQYLQSPVARDVRQGLRLDACRQDGSIFPASISLSPVMLGGEMLVTASVRDLRDDIAIEKKLRDAQKMEAVGTLVGGIAHDFNNILASIMGNIYLARLHDSKLDLRLDAVEREADRASGIVRKLLSFARKGILQKQALQLAPIVDAAVERFRQSLDQPLRLDVALLLDEEDGVIEADPEQIEQIVTDLLSNARDAVAGRPDAHVRVMLASADADEGFRQRHPGLVGRRFACLRVGDNGCGIPAQRLEHVFEPFYTTKDVGKGVGLGLAMIHGAVRSHHGIVELDSEEGRGTTVRIYLPLHEPQGEGGDARVVIESAAGKGGTVLIAEDEAELRDVLCTVMADQGYEVLAAIDGIEAIEDFLANSERVGLVIMDVLMPRMGGVAAAQRIREIHPEVPIIFITAHDREAIQDARIDALDHSAIINKPFAIDALLEVIATFLR
jgi:PAS domain S-box-containing protein